MICSRFHALRVLSIILACIAGLFFPTHLLGWILALILVITIALLVFLSVQLKKKISKRVSVSFTAVRINQALFFVSRSLPTTWSPSSWCPSTKLSDSFLRRAPMRKKKSLAFTLLSTQSVSFTPLDLKGMAFFRRCRWTLPFLQIQPGRWHLPRSVHLGSSLHPPWEQSPQQQLLTLWDGSVKKWYQKSAESWLAAHRGVGNGGAGNRGAGTRAAGNRGAGTGGKIHDANVDYRSLVFSDSSTFLVSLPSNLGRLLSVYQFVSPFTQKPIWVNIVFL